MSAEGFGCDHCLTGIQYDRIKDFGYSRALNELPKITPMIQKIYPTETGHWIVQGWDNSKMPARAQGSTLELALEAFSQQIK